MQMLAKDFTRAVGSIAPAMPGRRAVASMGRYRMQIADNDEGICLVAANHGITVQASLPATGVSAKNDGGSGIMQNPAALAAAVRNVRADSVTISSPIEGKRVYRFGAVTVEARCEPDGVLQHEITDVDFGNCGLDITVGAEFMAITRPVAFGSEKDFGVNCRYVLDCLDGLPPSDTVCMYLTDKSSPIRIATPGSDAGSLVILMPMRV